MCQRLGFLCDLTDEHYLSDQNRNVLRGVIPKHARSAFGFAERSADDIGFVSQWGLIVNAPKSALLAEVPSLSYGRVS
jgi:hypothetical protein